MGMILEEIRCEGGGRMWIPRLDEMPLRTPSAGYHIIDVQKVPPIAPKTPTVYATVLTERPQYRRATSIVETGIRGFPSRASGEALPWVPGLSTPDGIVIASPMFLHQLGEVKTPYLDIVERGAHTVGSVVLGALVLALPATALVLGLHVVS